MKIYISTGCFIGIVSFIVPVIKSENVESNIREYFDSEIVSRFNAIWKKQQKSFESAIVMAMQDVYGLKSMNVYIRRANEALQLAKGYYHTDNQVQLLLADMKLHLIPVLWFPSVNLNLSENIIKIKSNLNKMIISSSYILFRNQSDIIYDMKDQDPYKSSPFRFTQVKITGELIITMDSCILTGNILTMMSALSVNLGHGNLKLSNCRYTIEISPPGMGISPVIANYNFKGDGLNLEYLVMRPLNIEFLPKLQASLFSIINTSAIFGQDISNIRHKQYAIFHLIKERLNDAVRKMKKLAIDRNLNIAELEDFQIKWDDDVSDKKVDRYIRFTKLIMSGLETAYTANVGGPYKLNSIGFMEEIRFNSIQVRGNLLYGASTTDVAFSAEISDLAVHVNVDLNTNSDYEFEVTGWREFDLAASDLTFKSAETVITGYLLKVIPKHIVRHLSELFEEGSKLVMNIH